MKIVASSAVLLLMFSIISFGMPTFANAQSTEFPLTVSTDYPGYAENSEIIISGIVKESSLSEYSTPVTLMVISPDDNIVTIKQNILINILPDKCITLTKIIYCFINIIWNYVL